MAKFVISCQPLVLTPKEYFSILGNVVKILLAVDNLKEVLKDGWI